MSLIGVVDGTDGADLITRSYVDADGETARSVPDLNEIDGALVYGAIIRAGDGDDTITDSATSLLGDAFIYGEDGNDTFIVNDTSGVSNVSFIGGNGNDVFALSAPNLLAEGFRPVTAEILDFTAGEDVISIGGHILTRAGFENGFADIAGTVTLQDGEDGTRITFTADADSDHPATDYAASQSFNLKGIGLNDFIASLPSEEQVDGTSGADLITINYSDDTGDRLTRGADIVHAGAGDDRVYLNHGADTAYGEAGDDHIFGGKGHNVLYGGAGDDTLHSGHHTSALFGGEGNDILTAQLIKGGDHSLSGGADADTFRMVDAIVGKTSHVQISDFVAGEDVLEIDGVTIDFANLPEGVSMAEDDDGNAVLSFSDDETVTMQGVGVGTLVPEAVSDAGSYLDLGNGSMIPILPFDAASVDADSYDDEETVELA